MVVTQLYSAFNGHQQRTDGMHDVMYSQQQHLTHPVVYSDDLQYVITDISHMMY
jgi:hypothetical protein